MNINCNHLDILPDANNGVRDRDTMTNRHIRRHIKHQIDLAEHVGGDHLTLPVWGPSLDVRI